MAAVLPPLRPELEVFPSPVEDQPGVVIRDPMRYSDAALLLPPEVASGLDLFDGEHDLDALTERLTDVVGEAITDEEAREIVDLLRESGFLETEELEAMRAHREEEFREAEYREPAHAGSGYPEDEDQLRAELDRHRREHTAPSPPETGSPPLALAAPHVSPFGGAGTYAAAYRRLRSVDRDRLYIVLGTSHYGEPNRFGVTTKPFLTPFGETRPVPEAVRFLESKAKRSMISEDYCHSLEHSIEFQVVFLQHALGRSDLRILPILVGPFLESLATGKRPESDDDVQRFFDALSELRDREDDITFVLGVDLAHVGRRYGDSFDAKKGEGRMLEIELRDRERLARLYQGDTDGFFELMRKDADPLRWCGYSPLYTFSRIAPDARGHELDYDSWNIDEDSVVSFVAAEFPDESSA